jgi:hypothetical protein
MIQQWQDLLTQLGIDNYGIEQCNQTDLLRFETETEIVLPAGYKEYSQVFGTGLWGYAMQVYAPTQYLIEYSKETLDTFKEDLEMFPSENLERDQRMKALFDVGFVFATDSGAHVALWDLRTYGDDENYDIYWIDIDLIGDEYLIGRDFFEFITHFCLGRGSYDFLPEDMRPLPDTPQLFKSFISNPSWDTTSY